MISVVSYSNLSGSKTAHTTKLRQIGSIKLGVINAEHPLTAQIKELDKKIMDSKANLAAEELKEQDKNSSALTNYRAKLQAEIKSKLTARQEELTTEVTEKIDQKEEELAVRAEDYRAKLNKEYNSEILNLKLKLAVNNLTEQEQKDYQQRLRELKAEKEEKLKQYQKDKRAKINNLISREEKRLKAELLEYEKSLTKAAAKDYEDYLVSQQDKLALKREDKITDELDKVQKLVGQKEELIAERSQEIEDAAEELAHKKGIEIILTELHQNLKTVDLTTEVIAQFKGGGA